RLEIKEQELISSLREISTKDPEYVSLQTVSAPPLQSFQTRIPEDMTVLEFSVARDEVLALVLSRNRTTVVREVCPVRGIYYLEEKLRRLLSRMGSGHETKGPIELNLQETNQCLKDLYSKLLAPVTHLLTTSRLIIIPQGILHLLPFHAFMEGG